MRKVLHRSLVCLISNRPRHIAPARAANRDLAETTRYGYNDGCLALALDGFGFDMDDASSIQDNFATPARYRRWHATPEAVRALIRLQLLRMRSTWSCDRRLPMHILSAFGAVRQGVCLARGLRDQDHVLVRRISGISIPRLFGRNAPTNGYVAMVCMVECVAV